MITLMDELNLRLTELLILVFSSLNLQHHNVSAVANCSSNSADGSVCPLCLDNLLEFIIPDILIFIAYITSFFVFYKDQNYLNDLVNKVSP